MESGGRIVVIGASAGGVEALKGLFAALPADVPHAYFVVLHGPPTGRSVLPQILARSGPVPAEHAEDGKPIRGGVVVVAQPDHHLTLADGHVHVRRGPKENNSRPAVDPLFRTAATAYGPRAVGVILSGALDDGTAGLGAIKAAGGTTLVQDPAEAMYPSMPSSAIESVGPDAILPVAGIAAWLAHAPPLEPDPARSRNGERRDEMSDPTHQDPAITTAENEAVGERSAFTCPECSGLLWEFEEGGVVKLRCRVGHAYTEEAMLHHKAVALEAALWTAATALEEKSDFCLRLSRRFARGNMQIAAKRYEHQAANAREQAALVRQAIYNLEAPPEGNEEQAS